MRLTSFTDYSLRTLIHVAVHPEGKITIADVAAAFDISQSHLTKVVHFLGKAGMLVNTRGRGGGLQLAMPAAAINIAAVVHLTEGCDLPAECFDRARNACVITPCCELRGVLAEGLQAFYAVLEKYSLADLVKNRRELQKLLAPAARDRVELRNAGWP